MHRSMRGATASQLDSISFKNHQLLQPSPRTFIQTQQLVEAARARANYEPPAVLSPMSPRSEQPQQDASTKPPSPRIWGVARASIGTPWAVASSPRRDRIPLPPLSPRVPPPRSTPTLARIAAVPTSLSSGHETSSRSSPAFDPTRSLADDDSIFHVLDAPCLRAALAGDLRLMSAHELLRHWAAQGGEFRLLARQEIESRLPHLLLSPADAVTALRCEDRRVACVCYPHLTVAEPDPDGHTLADLCHFLRHQSGRHVTAVFIGWACLHQLPRTREQEIAFQRSLRALPHLFGSALGTMVVRTPHVPAQPPQPWMRGWVSLTGVRAKVTEEKLRSAIIAAIAPQQQQHEQQQPGVRAGRAAPLPTRSAYGLGTYSPLADLHVRLPKEYPKDLAVETAAKKKDSASASAQQILPAAVGSVEEAAEKIIAAREEEAAAFKSWRLKFRSHEEAAQAVRLIDGRLRAALDAFPDSLEQELLAPLLGAKVALEYNSQPHRERGWAVLEMGVCIEVVQRASFFPQLRGRLLAPDLPKKVVDVLHADGEPPRIDLSALGIPNKLGDCDLDGAAARLRLIRRSLSLAGYAGGDGAVVCELLARFHQKTLSAFRAAAEMLPQATSTSTYEGEHNAQGEREGEGKAVYANGETYLGQWVADKRHGEGKVLYANGDVFRGSFDADLKQGAGVYVDAEGVAIVTRHREGRMVGEGVRLPPNRKTATRVRNGEAERKPEAISLQEAERIAREVGVEDLPPKHLPIEPVVQCLFWEQVPGTGRVCPL